MRYNKLKGRMRELSCTQEGLARILGITVQALNAKLNGRSEFTVEEASKISWILKIDNPTEYFFAHKIPKMQQQ